MTEEYQNDDRAPDQNVPQLSEFSVIDRLGISPWVYALIVLCVIFFSYQIIGSIISVLIFKTTQVTPENVRGVRIQTALAQIFLLLIPTLVLARLQTKNLRLLFRFNTPSIKSVFFAIVGVFALQQVLQVYLYFQDQIPLPHVLKPQIDEVRKMIEEIYRMLITAHSITELFFVITVAALIPSICEEFLFRGFLPRGISRKAALAGGLVLLLQG